MNSSPEITVVHQPAPKAGEKQTVPEMFLLYHLIAQAALDPRRLRRSLDTCTPEQRQFLHTFFVGATK